MRAFQETGLISFFMQSLWSDRPGHYKLSHALYWWHWIDRHLANCAEGECWEAPLIIKGAEFKKLEYLMSTQMPKQSKQVDRFIETARALGCDEDKERFEKSLGKIAAYKPPKKSKAQEAGQKSARRGGSAGASGGSRAQPAQ